jgi:predicted RNA-binding protein YlxR (DUF448 family)
MAKKKHTPQRTCIACRQVKDKRDLIRVVRTPEGDILLDPSGKANGRGVYLCKETRCWEKGATKERLSQALKIPVTLEQVEKLQGSF